MSKLTRPDTPAAFRPGRYAVIRPPPPPLEVRRIISDTVIIPPTSLPGKPERLTVKPPRR